jgi:hypothetical protein
VAYYYLMAQLPSLSYGDPVPMSPHSFRELCGANLSPADARLLPFCTLNPWDGAPEEAAAGEPGFSEFVGPWREWERALRFNLARYRAARAKREAPAEVPEYPADAAAAAKAAVAMDSPLEAEIFLDQSRWRAIETFQGLDYFDRNTVYAYLLKLLLMERRSCFRAEEGFAEYKGLYAAVMGAAGSGAFSRAGTSTSNESGEPK